MLNRAIEAINKCQSLDELKAVWVDHAEEWKALSVKDAAVILERKESRKREFVSVRRWLVDSEILGRVPVVWDPKQPAQVLVDGVAYGQDEVKCLLSKGLSADNVQALHDTKATFGGQIVSNGKDRE